MSSNRYSCQILFSLNFSTDFGKISKYQISRKSVQWEPSCSMRTDRNDYTFRNFANAPNKWSWSTLLPRHWEMFSVVFGQSLVFEPRTVFPKIIPRTGGFYHQSGLYKLRRTCSQALDYSAVLCSAPTAIIIIIISPNFRVVART
jgi:hypothetical protein